MSPPSRIVFVGNIPWDATEESMSELFQEAGPLVSFRLVIDKDTLKPKGYGFAEYHDIETAKSAVRNLNDLDLGGRKLRVDFAESDMAAKSLGLDLPRPSSSIPATNLPLLSSTNTSTTIQPTSFSRASSITPPLAHQSLLTATTNTATSSLPMPPPSNVPASSATMAGTINLTNLSNPMVSSMNPTPVNPTTTSPFPPTQSATDAISSVISGMTKEKLIEVLTNVKVLSTTQPDQVRALLSGNPQLTYCLMQMMLVCGLVDPTAIQNIVKNVTATNPPVPSSVIPPPSAPPPATYANLTPSSAQMDPRLAASSISIPTTQPMALPTPTPAPLAYSSTPLANPLAAMTVQQRQLLLQVFSLSPAHIEALPPDQKATVLQLRAQFPHFPNMPQAPI